MKKKLAWLLTFSLIVTMLSACGSSSSAEQASDEDTQEEAAVEEEAEEPEEAVEETEPAEEAAEEVAIKVAFIMSDTLENTYNNAMYMSLQKLQSEGYDFTFDIAENTTADNAEAVMRTYCDAGYNVILAHAGITRDPAVKLAAEYPDVYFLGGGNSWDTSQFPNLGAYDMATNESCYLLGVAAALTSKSGVIGYVGAMESANINGEVNAYRDGAKSVNPDIEVIVSFINSWYDPVKAKECTNAQIAQGADIVFAERDGVLDACIEGGIYCLCDKTDQTGDYPDTMLGCAVCYWDTAMKEAFDLIKTGSFENRYYTSYEGAIAGGYTDAILNANLVDDACQTEVDSVREQIVSGELVVPFNPEA